MAENTEYIRAYEDILSDISELARTFLDERKIYGELRVEVKKRMARVRLYVVNGLTEFLTDEEVIRQLELIKENKTKLTLDTIDALVALEVGEDYDCYEAAKFNSETSEKAFPMFQAELSGHQSQFKKDAAELNTIEYAERMSGKNHIRR